MKYSSLLLLLLWFSGCWEVRYMDNFSSIKQLEDRGCKVKYKKNRYGVYRVRYKCLEEDE